MWVTQAGLVFVGGGLGACLRWLLGLACAALFPAYNAGVLLANLIGCFLIGVGAGVFETRLELPAELRLLTITGFLGGFTTFSSFSLETLALFRTSPALATGYAVAKTALCLLLTAAGLAVATKWLGGLR